MRVVGDERRPADAGTDSRGRSGNTTTMTELDKDTLLDLVVNIIPIGILGFFSLLFIAFNPWGWDPFPILITHFLTLFPLAILVVVTYVAGRVIQRDETESA